MMILPVPVQGQLRLLIVLEDENWERIKEHDCAEVNWKDLQPELRMLPVHSVHIGYVTPEERAKIVEFQRIGDMAAAIKLITGGFKVKPGDGVKPEKLK